MHAHKKCTLLGLETPLKLFL